MPTDTGGASLRKAFVPLAATLYLAVSTAWTLGERGLMRRVLWTS
ncbi:hypothetical protein BH10ACT6_BH10ACT6_01030 [soil metagenome]